uniref:Uncharacterized protein n=1 Tax=Glossina palpalis gambiensis TaxID=67801 RepID=A0A1B0BV36_9MUSC
MLIADLIAGASLVGNTGSNNLGFYCTVLKMFFNLIYTVTDFPEMSMRVPYHRRRIGISYVSQSSSILSMNSSGFVSPSYLTGHSRTRSVALLIDINSWAARLGLVARDLVPWTVNFVLGVYLVSSSSNRSIVSLLVLVEPASTPSAFPISSTVITASRPYSAQRACDHKSEVTDFQKFNKKLITAGDQIQTESSDC